MTARQEITVAVVDALKTLQSRKEYRATSIIRGPVDTKIANGKDTYNIYVSSARKTDVEELDMDGDIITLEYDISVVFSTLYIEQEDLRDDVIDVVEQALKLVGDVKCVLDSTVVSITPLTETNYVITNIVLAVRYIT